jgi:hypothetical protein
MAIVTSGLEHKPDLRRTFVCWIEEIQEREDAEEVKAFDHDMAAELHVQEMHAHGALSSVGEGDSFVVNVEKVDDKTVERWRATASYVLEFSTKREPEPQSPPGGSPSTT